MHQAKKTQSCFGYRKGHLRFPRENTLPLLHAVTFKRIADKGGVVAISTIFYAVSPPEKELWYQAGMSFQNFHEMHLATCELDCLQCIPLAMFVRVVKMEGELWWWFELSSLLGWAVEPTEKTNGFWSIRIALWVTWVQRTQRSSSHTSTDANKEAQSVPKRGVLPTPTPHPCPVFF